MTTTGNKLFTPLTVGKDLVLKNRIVLGPMTRARSNPVTREVNEINAVYYEQRAGAGLIITEATSVSEQGHGWYGAPALYTAEHAVAWKKVTDRVHAKNGKIFAQIWHMGRQGHSSFNSKNDLVSASAIRLESGTLRNSNGESVSPETPRALETDEIPGIVDDFRQSAKLAMDAGFDGVEIHAANGYLIDQFLQSTTNKRTDKYGGSIENRARFLLEVVEAIKTVCPAERIGVRLSPNGGFAGMGSVDNPEQFTYALTKLGEKKIGYVALLDGVGFGYHDKSRLLTVFDAKAAFKGLVLANNSYTRDIAEGAIRSGAADLVSFGRPYISTPDLAERFENDWPLNPDASYEDYWTAGKGASGYTDFPFYKS